MTETITATNLRARALAALDEQQRQSEAAGEERERRHIEEANHRLIRRVKEVLGLDVEPAAIEWREDFDRNGTPTPTVLVDGIRFYLDYTWNLGAGVGREGCEHETRRMVDRSGDVWASLGALLRHAADEAAKPCEACAFEEAENAPAPAVSPAPPPPSLGERLDELVREIVRDEMWRREEGA